MNTELRHLVAIAATMRATAGTWAEIATRVERSPKTCRDWPSKQRSLWEPAYAEALAMLSRRPQSGQRIAEGVLAKELRSRCQNLFRVDPIPASGTGERIPAAREEFHQQPIMRTESKRVFAPSGRRMDVARVASRPAACLPSYPRIDGALALVALCACLSTVPVDGERAARVSDQSDGVSHRAADGVSAIDRAAGGRTALCDTGAFAEMAIFDERHRTNSTWKTCESIRKCCECVRIDCERTPPGIALISRCYPSGTDLASPQMVDRLAVPLRLGASAIPSRHQLQQSQRTSLFARSAIAAGVVSDYPTFDSCVGWGWGDFTGCNERGHRTMLAVCRDFSGPKMSRFSHESNL